jgi:hypothetical protein
MSAENALIDSALRAWQGNLDRAGKFFSGFTEDQLQQEVAPGKNRLIYLWGHLAAVNDALIPLLGVGERLHPELDAVFISAPDRTSQDTLTGAALKQQWDSINAVLSAALVKLSPAEWLERHTSVSEEDFKREPHRNRFTILLGRTSHIAYHLGQAKLAAK